MIRDVSAETWEAGGTLLQDTGLVRLEEPQGPQQHTAPSCTAQLSPQQQAPQDGSSRMQAAPSWKESWGQKAKVHFGSQVWGMLLCSESQLTS